MLDEESQTRQVKVGTPPLGGHVLYARARVDRTTSEVTTSRFTVRSDSMVEWQVVDRNSPDAADAWRTASGLDNWSFRFNTVDYPAPGPKTVVVRLLHHGLEIARDTVRVRFG